jgi:predicted ArsR family transcriptional regulator
MSEPADKPSRYSEDGNVHLDFHGATNTTIDFIVSRYGIEAMHEIFKKVGRDVYQDIRRHLMEGDADELVKHWRHFFDRESADYDISVTDDQIVLTVRHCTAWHHVKAIAPGVSPFFCDQTVVTNNAMAEGTPFAVETTVLGGGACTQVIRRRS